MRREEVKSLLEKNGLDFEEWSRWMHGQTVGVITECANGHPAEYTDLYEGKTCKECGSELRAIPDFYRTDVRRWMEHKLQGKRLLWD